MTTDLATRPAPPTREMRQFIQALFIKRGTLKSVQASLPDVWVFSQPPPGAHLIRRYAEDVITGRSEPPQEMVRRVGDLLMAKEVWDNFDTSALMKAEIRKMLAEGVKQPQLVKYLADGAGFLQDKASLLQHGPRQASQPTQMFGRFNFIASGPAARNVKNGKGGRFERASVLDVLPSAEPTTGREMTVAQARGRHG